MLINLNVFSSPKNNWAWCATRQRPPFLANHQLEERTQSVMNYATVTTDLWLSPFSTGCCAGIRVVTRTNNLIIRDISAQRPIVHLISNCLLTI